MKRNLIMVFLVIIIAVIAFVIMKKPVKKTDEGGNMVKGKETDSTWRAPNLEEDVGTTGKEREMILYGQDLIAHTAKYLGPKGTVAHTTNGMNCQNCHLDAGTRAWGNNYAAVYSTYPQLRGRSNTLQDIYG
ncbi:MAG: c-type cytochrome, partial [Segetibacter sp.]